MVRTRRFDCRGRGGLPGQILQAVQRGQEKNEKRKKVLQRGMRTLLGLF